MRPRRSSRELVACHARDGQLTKALLILDSHLDDGSRFPTDHGDHLLITLSCHGYPINTDDLIPVSKSRLVSRSTRMDHADIEDSWVTDPFGPDLKRNTDDPLGQLGTVSMPIGSLSRVLICHGT
jgi:hypothetical protein